MTAREVLRKLKTLEFVVDHVSGSHYIRSASTSVQLCHFMAFATCGAGTFLAIVKQAGVTEDTFHRL